MEGVNTYQQLLNVLNAAQVNAALYTQAASYQVLKKKIDDKRKELVKDHSVLGMSTTENTANTVRIIMYGFIVLIVVMVLAKVLNHKPKSA